MNTEGEYQIKKNPLHRPVLLNEVIQYLEPRSNQNFIDATVGGGGHAERILELTAPQGILLGFDLDPQALVIAEQRLKKFKERVRLFQANFTEIKKIIYGESEIHKFNGFLLDLGISSYQLGSESRGFSFQTNGLLDMRLGPTVNNLTAAVILNEWAEGKIIRILKELGEERYSQEIAKAITAKRKREKFHNTKQLVEIVESVYQNKPKPHKIHPATKTFQALRIAVNGELDNLRTVLPQALELLLPKGRMATISFHSLEDRIVKQFFRQEAKDCLCPPEFPVCRCGHQKQLRILTKKVIKPSREEIKQNHRARSAKLRAAEKLSN
ncbi:MAG: 16S rRNA (cytosine(1402)-N(4))-methyltransferase [Candidatus Kerfeldbacteria bacterium CG_4_10_14_0_8_um_filter_42_10]|uniref:Ribosomal RNA small subunit methyltransferase H n=1 Tax=Candidatus Kerfeldbacteria bacterium CG_4_10_14_0_8_um_filter_42_10 TaxID=2014248 RepID=A0A2M7RKI9_9BACT|nr:MAG: 16S rRNA (cytosine(1402)-N(4))-methyltransferase [Candidatus Kerfeldbacteria bacterium CG_4_10_14_0_8_um_filter_42_10]